MLPEFVRTILRPASSAYYRLISSILQHETPRDERYWTIHPYAMISKKRLRLYKNLHQGQRCFIIGNGPSLSQMDLRPLKKEVTFGLNRIYMLFPKMGFDTTYLVSVNKLVIEQCAKDMAQLHIPLFISWRSRQYVPLKRNVIFINSLYKTGRFSFDPTLGIYESGTVTCAALQLAYYMGFTKAILIGVDHNFTTKGPANQTVVSEGKDPNHFNPDYFGKGFRWQLPDLESSEAGYHAVKSAYEESGRQVLDATVGGKLQVFEKVDFTNLFNE
jgi:hypothetical protein